MGWGFSSQYEEQNYWFDFSYLQNNLEGHAESFPAALILPMNMLQQSSEENAARKSDSTGTNRNKPRVLTGRVINFGHDCNKCNIMPSHQDGNLDSILWSCEMFYWWRSKGEITSQHCWNIYWVGKNKGKNTTSTLRQSIVFHIPIDQKAHTGNA